jgi:hypothetical protein
MTSLKAVVFFLVKLVEKSEDAFEVYDSGLQKGMHNVKCIEFSSKCKETGLHEVWLASVLYLPQPSTVWKFGML